MASQSKRNISYGHVPRTRSQWLLEVILERATKPDDSNFMWEWMEDSPEGRPRLYIETTTGHLSELCNQRAYQAKYRLKINHSLIGEILRDFWKGFLGVLEDQRQSERGRHSKLREVVLTLWDRHDLNKNLEKLEELWQEKKRQLEQTNGDPNPPSLQDKETNYQGSTRPLTPSPVRVQSTSANEASQLPQDIAETVRCYSQAAREALNPRILERISRKLALADCLKLIRRSLEQECLAIAIIGPAGYGKSTFLGELYDRLVSEKQGWVGLLLCNSLSIPKETGESKSLVDAILTLQHLGTLSLSQAKQSALEHEFGYGLCGQSRSIVEVCLELTQLQGSGILLIDTLDLVLNADLVKLFQQMVWQLLSQGVTVLFTCRDHDFFDYLEPIHEKLPALANRFECQPIPDFSKSEIQQAACNFYQTHEPGQAERGKAFAENLLKLSADSRPLSDIIKNPLLLALLCELFAREEQVPPDLTVSKLYQKYWFKKVRYSRQELNHSGALAIAKDQLCLTIAEYVFRHSHDRLCESFFDSELQVDGHGLRQTALNDLLSEGVLQRLSSDKLHFFHQTLLEYAIAYWLGRDSNQSCREQLLNQVNQGDRTFWVPVLRQLLAILDDADFDICVEQLDLSDSILFGAVAYAAAARDEPAVLRQLLPTALQLGEIYQKRLRDALETAPRSLIVSIWDALLTLVQQPNQLTAGNTAQLLGLLLKRWWTALQSELPKTLTAIATRPGQPVSGKPDSDERGQLYGWLLSDCWPVIAESPSTEVLLALREHIHLFGHGVCAGVLELHTAASIPARAQTDLLRRLLTAPVADYTDIRQALNQFLSVLLPRQIESGDFPLGNTWFEVLHRQLPERWHYAQTAAVGQWAGQNQALCLEIFEAYFTGPPETIRNNRYALLESMKAGSGHWIIQHLQTLNDQLLKPSQLERIVKLWTPESVGMLTPEDQEQLVQWLRPYIPQHAPTLCLVLDLLADASPTALLLLRQIVDHLPVKKRRQIQNQLLRFKPIAQHPPLHTLNQNEQRYLIDFYQRQAAQNPIALEKLLATAQDHRVQMAVRASDNLYEVSGNQLMPEDLLPLLTARANGVRENALKELSKLRAETALSTEVMTKVCQSLEAETNRSVAQAFGILVEQWVKQTQSVLPAMIETLVTILDHIIENDTLEGGLSRVYLSTLQPIINFGDFTLDVSRISHMARQLLTHRSLDHINNGASEMLAVLTSLRRIYPDLFLEIVADDLQGLVEKEWYANIKAVIIAIYFHRGTSSDLLQTIAREYQGNATLQNLLSRTQGF